MNLFGLKGGAELGQKFGNSEYGESSALALAAKTLTVARCKLGC